jgi:uncharacterized protein (DUF1330 family)
MAAYIIVDLTVKDQEALQEYGSQTPQTLSEFGGKAVGKGAVTALHGDARFERKVILEFPDKDSALGWYNSDAYQRLIPVREKAFKSQFHLVE